MKLQLIKSSNNTNIDDPWSWLKGSVIGSKEVLFEGNVLRFLNEMFPLVNGEQLEEEDDIELLKSMYSVFRMTVPNFQYTSQFKSCQQTTNQRNDKLNEASKTTLVFGAGSNNLGFENSKYSIETMGYFKAKNWLYVTVKSAEETFKYYIVLDTGKRYFDSKNAPKNSVHFKDLIPLEKKFLGGTHEELYAEYKSTGINIKNFIKNHNGEGTIN